METQRPPLSHSKVVHAVAHATECLSESNTDAVLLRERREDLSGHDGVIGVNVHHPELLPILSR
jgi:hypothetical protein